MAYQLTINPLWVPQRRGIAENELADDLALSIVGVRPIETEPFLKVGPHLPQNSFRIPYRKKAESDSISVDSIFSSKYYRFCGMDAETPEHLLLHSALYKKE